MQVDSECVTHHKACECHNEIYIELYHAAKDLLSEADILVTRGFYAETVRLERAIDQMDKIL